MEAFRTGFRSFQTRDRSLIAPTQELIERTGGISQGMVGYMIRLSAKSKVAEERSITNLHSNLGDIMRIAEIADTCTKYTQKAMDQELVFSETVQEDLTRMAGRVETLYQLTKRAILEKDQALLPQVAAVEDEIDAMRKELIDGHIRRLNAGECRAESSGVFINLVSNLERLGDHLTYIADTVQN